MTGADLGATALTAARTAAQDVIDVGAETIAANISFFFVVAIIGVALLVVRFIMKRFTRAHRG